jgi:hypothetical protein
MAERGVDLVISLLHGTTTGPAHGRHRGRCCRLCVRTSAHSVADEQAARSDTDTLRE